MLASPHPSSISSTEPLRARILPCPFRMSPPCCGTAGPDRLPRAPGHRSHRCPRCAPSPSRIGAEHPISRRSRGSPPRCDEHRIRGAAMRVPRRSRAAARHRASRRGRRPVVAARHQLGVPSPRFRSTASLGRPSRIRPTISRSRSVCWRMVVMISGTRSGPRARRHRSMIAPASTDWHCLSSPSATIEKPCFSRRRSNSRPWRDPSRPSSIDADHGRVEIRSPGLRRVDEHRERADLIGADAALGHVIGLPPAPGTRRKLPGAARSMRRSAPSASWTCPPRPRRSPRRPGHPRPAGGRFQRARPCSPSKVQHGLSNCPIQQRCRDRRAAILRRRPGERDELALLRLMKPGRDADLSLIHPAPNPDQRRALGVLRTPSARMSAVTAPMSASSRMPACTKPRAAAVRTSHCVSTDRRSNSSARSSWATS